MTNDEITKYVKDNKLKLRIVSKIHETNEMIFLFRTKIAYIEPNIAYPIGINEINIKVTCNAFTKNIDRICKRRKIKKEIILAFIESYCQEKLNIIRGILQCGIGRKVVDKQFIVL